MRREYLKYVTEYTDKLEPLMNKLEQENKWDFIERREVTNYSFDRDGILFKFRVKKGLFDEKIETKTKTETKSMTRMEAGSSDS